MYFITTNLTNSILSSTFNSLVLMVMPHLHNLTSVYDNAVSTALGCETLLRNPFYGICGILYFEGSCGGQQLLIQYLEQLTMQGIEMLEHWPFGMLSTEET